MLTQEILKYHLHYCPETGIFTWLVPAAHRMKPGDIAGWTHKRGYRDIRVLGKIYKVHRLAWLYIYGVWPTKGIDHINGITGDNRIQNLREANNAQNLHNSKLRKDNTSGYHGVSWSKSHNKWIAKISYRGKERYIGSYSNAEEAAEHYLFLAEIIHGEFLRADKY
jgi:hypothetical protein